MESSQVEILVSGHKVSISPVLMRILVTSPYTFRVGPLYVDFRRHQGSTVVRRYGSVSCLW